MKKRHLFTLWGGLFIVCVVLGFIPTLPQGLGAAMAVLFFLPPAWLCRRAALEKDRRTLQLLRNLAAASLALTTLMLVWNILALPASSTVGNLLYTVLIVVTTPMICGGVWFLSLFLWACLLIAAVDALKKA